MSQDSKIRVVISGASHGRWIRPQWLVQICARSKANLSHIESKRNGTTVLNPLKNLIVQAEDENKNLMPSIYECVEGSTTFRKFVMCC